MRRFMRDDVVRQAGEPGLAGQVAARLGAAGLEIAEQNAVRRGAVEGIGLAHCVRKKIETFGSRCPRRWRGTGLLDSPPVNLPAESRFEPLQGFACHRVDHLLMEARIGFTRSEASANQQFRVVEVDGCVISLGEAIVVYDSHPLANPSALTFLFPAHPSL